MSQFSLDSLSFLIIVLAARRGQSTLGKNVSFFKIVLAFTIEIDFIFFIKHSSFEYDKR